MYTPRQQHLIEQAKSLGYGYKLFALSVEKQGWCSARQETALDNMVSAGTYRKNNWVGSRRLRKSRSRTGYSGAAAAAVLDWDDYDGAEESHNGAGCYDAFYDNDQ